MSSIWTPPCPGNHDSWHVWMMVVVVFFLAMQPVCQLAEGTIIFHFQLSVTLGLENLEPWVHSMAVSFPWIMSVGTDWPLHICDGGTCVCVWSCLQTPALSLSVSISTCYPCWRDSHMAWANVCFLWPQVKWHLSSFFRNWNVHTTALISWWMASHYQNEKAMIPCRHM